MAGVRYSVRLNDSEIQEALNQLIKRGSNLMPAMMEIGEELLISHDQRFRDKKSPDGVPWAPLSETTKSLKTKNVDTILVLNGLLSGTLNYQASSDNLLFGSPLEYAATHQFGRVTSPNSMIPNKAIPARPFLGVDENDREMILETLSDYLLNG
ncbi:TPA: phage virion morphogenesis protein [Vibrio parahaemolyticus]|uniref:phage virion morphogenesis protein n=1 Tax=Vibrio parahaemolyticus TaxID=670 RepID=UPI00200B1060|nr:phage virion morphogenesis protein [Vibrio parahaemolyticus]UPR17285.1 phage virion morphogenesis protein [Vibrio parahaemolyticus]UPR23269.1 phage virion morphogenesis protein [Vibrio parahaemolyticus]HAV1517119.1 phage virion morphogenesis protein [Vibrio parahaemolyticus]HAV1521820.1 phage virion morphogenesis protein [Vibrio parahaemolyticus]HAV1536083.1 phage virion morphogenesis protein [Vibrio parahaemolyticus]